MDSPMVSGTNRKWYRAVRANCRRESPTTSRSIKESPSGYGVDVATASCRLALAASTGDRCALEKNNNHSSPSAANFAASSQASSRRKWWRRVVDAFVVLAVSVICRFYSARAEVASSRVGSLVDLQIFPETAALRRRFAGSRLLRCFALHRIAARRCCGVVVGFSVRRLGSRFDSKCRHDHLLRG